MQEAGLPSQAHLCGLGNITLFLIKFSFVTITDKNSGTDSTMKTFLSFLQDSWDSHFSEPCLE